jgi:hypothetical protein
MWPNINSLLNHPLCAGVPVLQTPHSSHVTVGVTTSKLCEDLIFGNSVRQCVYRIYGFVSKKQLETFGYAVGVFIPRKFHFIFFKF